MKKLVTSIRPNMVIVLFSVFALLLCTLSVSASEKKSLNDEIKKFTDAISSHPKDPHGYQARGYAYIRAVQYDRALKDFDRAIEIDPKNNILYYDRGMAYRNLGLYDPAIRDLTRVINSYPNFMNAYHERGRAYMGKGHYELAIADFTKVIRDDSKPFLEKSIKLLKDAGFDFSDWKSPNTAKKDDPQRAAIYFDRGLAYAYQAQYEPAIDDLAEAVELNPFVYQYHLVLGRTYMNAAKNFIKPTEQKALFAMADYEIEQAVLLEPQSKDARRLYGEVSLLAMNLNRAVRIYEDLVWEEKDIRNTQDLFRLFTCYATIPYIERGIYFFQQKLKKMPEWQDLRYFLAILYLRGGNKGYAVSLIKQVMSSPKTSKNLMDLSRQTLEDILQ